MLVWSPNHCVSDAKREWVGPWVHAYSWGLGFMLVCLRSGLEAEVWVQLLHWGSGSGVYPCLGGSGLGVVIPHPRPGPIHPCS